MQRQDFSERRSGQLLKHERGYWAFVPGPLPPDLSLTWELSGELSGELSAVDRGVSELAGLAGLCPTRIC